MCGFSTNFTLYICVDLVPISHYIYMCGFSTNFTLYICVDLAPISHYIYVQINHQFHTRLDTIHLSFTSIVKIKSRPLKSLLFKVNVCNMSSW